MLCAGFRLWAGSVANAQHGDLLEGTPYIGIPSLSLFPYSPVSVSWGSFPSTTCASILVSESATGETQPRTGEKRGCSEEASSVNYDSICKNRPCPGDNDSTEAMEKLERGPHAHQAGKPFDWDMNGLTRAARPGNLGPDNPLLGSGAFCAS